MVDNLRNISFDVNIVHNYDREVSESFYKLPEKIMIKVNDLIEKSVTIGQFACITTGVTLVWMVVRYLSLFLVIFNCTSLRTARLFVLYIYLYVYNSLFLE